MNANKREQWELPIRAHSRLFVVPELLRRRRGSGTLGGLIGCASLVVAGGLIALNLLDKGREPVPFSAALLVAIATPK